MPFVGGNPDECSVMYKASILSTDHRAESVIKSLICDIAEMRSAALVRLLGRCSRWLSSSMVQYRHTTTYSRNPIVQQILEEYAEDGTAHCKRDVQREIEEMRVREWIFHISSMLRLIYVKCAGETTTS